MFTRDERDRRVIDRRRLIGLAAGAVALPLVGRLPVAAQDAPSGGHMKVAIIGEPPAVADAMFTTATVTNNVAQQIFEGLFAFDSTFNPRPMLLGDFEMSQDGLTFSGKLRQGAKFHDGSPVTAADVVASLKRWGAINGRGKLIFKRLQEITAPDSTTARMTFKQPSGILPSFLARAEAFIVPAAVAEAAGEKQIPEDKLIGTGPFKFGEHKVDQYLRFVKFADYEPRSEEPDGLAGKRVPLLDTLDFVPVPDESVRVDGLTTGEYHFADTVPADFSDQLSGDPSITALTVKPYYWYSPHFNKAQGLFTNEKLRQAVQLCFSQSEAMLAGFGKKEFVRFDPSVCGEETAWYSNTGAGAYDKPDPEQAKALLQEGGYKGETIRWLATKEYGYNFLMADYTKQQMEAIGMKVELVISDWATLVQNRAKKDAYEIFLTGHSQYSHPATQPFNDAAWPGFWDDKEKDAVVDRMVAETDPTKLKAAIDDYTRLIWQKMPFVKCGDDFLLRGVRNEVKGYQNLPDWCFWNVGVSGS